MGRKAKRLKVLARRARLLGSEEAAPQPTPVSNAEVQEKLEKVKKEEKKIEKPVEKEEEVVVSNEPTPVLSKEASIEPKKPTVKAKSAPKVKPARKSRGSTKKS
jgi:hypothetical protein